MHRLAVRDRNESSPRLLAKTGPTSIFHEIDGRLRPAPRRSTRPRTAATLDLARRIAVLSGGLRALRIGELTSWCTRDFIGCGNRISDAYEKWMSPANTEIVAGASAGLRSQLAQQIDKRIERGPKRRPVLHVGFDADPLPELSARPTPDPVADGLAPILEIV